MSEVLTKSDVASQVILLIQEFSEVSAISPQATLFDLGIDSLESVDLQYVLEDAFGSEPLTKAEQDSIHSVGDIIEVFWNRVQAGSATCPKDHRAQNES
jgi:acyl carrier protein